MKQVDQISAAWGDSWQKKQQQQFYPYDYDFVIWSGPEEPESSIPMRESPGNYQRKLLQVFPDLFASC